MNYQRKVILSGLIGNIVEAYDVSLCYFLAADLSRVLLGDASAKPAVMLSLVFIAYLAKPIGAFILGLFSDLYGRRTVLSASIIIMGFATALIGVIPSYHSIGIAAVGCLLGLRIIQSMALGSEFLNSASYLVESGVEQQRGFRGCWSSVGVKAGYLIACLCALGLHHFAPQGSNNAWRFAFLLAVLGTIVGYVIRSKTPESLAYVLYYAQRKPPSTQEIYRQSIQYIKTSPFLFYFAFCSSFLAVTTGFFYYLYIPIHAGQYSTFSSSAIMWSNISALALVVILIPAFGWLSDYCDRLLMLILATMGLLLLAYPLLWAISYGTIATFNIMQLLVSVCCAGYYSVATVILTELFPLQIRCTALSLIYSIAASLASGVPPVLAITWLG